MTTTTAFDVTMPQLGETVSEGTVTGWLVEVGATISAGDALLEVSTDKVDTELPSPVSGVVTEIIAAAGETVAVGAVIGRIAVEGEAATAASQPASVPGPTAVDAAASQSHIPVSAPPPPTLQSLAPLAGVSVATPAGARLRVSPVARRLAADLQIDLASVVGTGPEGAVVKRDIELMGSAGASPSSAPMTLGTRSASLLEASVQVELDAIDRTGATHALVTYVIRAIVDSLRAASRDHDDLRHLVEPSVEYIHAPTGRTVAIPSAAGLRLAGLTSRLEGPADSAEEVAGVAVTILDCTDVDCSISGSMSGAMSVSIGRRETVPTLSADNGRVSITFQDVCRLSIAVDGAVISVQALIAFAGDVKQVIESRDWSTEL